MQRVQELPLVLVQTFYLYVEDAVGVDDDAVLLFDVLREFQLVGAFDLIERVGGVLVVLEVDEFFQLGRVAQPTVSDPFGDELGEFRVGFRHPSPMRDAVGDVGEFFGSDFVVVYFDVYLSG